MAYVNFVRDLVARRNPAEPEFHQAVQEVLDSLQPVLERHPEYEKNRILERLTEPERVMMFRVPWQDDRGEVQVNRGRFTFKRGTEMIASFTGQKDTVCSLEVQKAEEAFLKDARIKLYASQNHLTDFLTCVQSRKKPITSEQVGGRSAICCHLMNQAYYHGQKLKWNAEKFAFVGGTGDPTWLTRDYRSPWKV